MKAHGMLFKSDMVLALLNTKENVWPPEPINADRPFKFQTRRTMKPQPTQNIADADKHWALWGNSLSLTDDEMETMEEWTCPHPVGQVIYARETFKYVGERIVFFAGDNSCAVDRALGPWKPGIHMPKAIARLWFVVKRVRVERVSSISEADCIAEGINGREMNGAGAPSGREIYSELFDSINGAGAFERGDWCWCYDLARISKSLFEKGDE